MFSGCLFLTHGAHAVEQARYVEATASKGSLALVQNKQACPIYVDSSDYAGVIRAVTDLRGDVARVTGITPALAIQTNVTSKSAILVGTLGKSDLIQRLVRDKKIDVSSISGKWESFLIQTVRNPLPGVASGLVIVGSDKRGTTYGLYDLSQQIGVSPWNWWADVPVKHHDSLFVKAGRHIEGEPAVKYRGIFLNDEEPALGNWTRQTFGDFNSKFYTRVYELLLRLKANYLWPAMWGKSLYEADPESARLADEYGIVIGTSHHEPMMRAQRDWTPFRDKGGQWNYVTNGAQLRDFWREGVRRNKNYETLTTIGMRGDGDEPMMPNEDDAAKLMETIVADQRKIIAEEVNPDLTKVPQLWALYKEVQSYYEKGMRVPDDVTLLWCDDNWGNLRRLPTPAERNRKGGAGVYYHFDYVGGPRCYKWINTNPLPKVWEQMNLAHQTGANRIWIVNVGDLKPMELPIEFFLDFARDPKSWTRATLPTYTLLWAQREFGTTYASQIAALVDKYAKYNGRRKPELLAPDTFSLVNFNEAETVISDWRALVQEAEVINNKLPADARAAFFELVLYPVKACAIVNEMYYAVGKNRLYAAQGRSSTNDWAAQARALFAANGQLSKQYHQIAGGKWNHMMSQIRIGYTSWSEPPRDIMPEVKTLEVMAPPTLWVAVEGAVGTDRPALPRFESFGCSTHWVDVFNKGGGVVNFSLAPNVPWIVADQTKGTTTKETRVQVRIDWSKAPAGNSRGTLNITSPQGGEVAVQVEAFKATVPARFTGFVEADGVVSIEAENFSRQTNVGVAKWESVPDYGRTLGGMTTSPVTTTILTPLQKAPCLEYSVYFWKPGRVNVQTILAPTLNFAPDHAQRLAISFDDAAPQTIELPRQTLGYEWGEGVKNNAFILKSGYDIATMGAHTLKIWMIDGGVTLQKIVVNTGATKSTYLGPPQSYKSGEARKNVQFPLLFDPRGEFRPAFYAFSPSALVETAPVTAKVNGPAPTTFWPSESGTGRAMIALKDSEGSVSTGIPPGSGLLQTFQGDGRWLDSVVYLFSNTSAPVDGKQYTLSLLDFGTNGPITEMGAMNVASQPLFSRPFTWSASRNSQKVTFNFAATERVLLAKDHYYGFFLDLANSGADNAIERSRGNIYPNGRLAIGSQGNWGLNFAGGDRDAHFALYTSPNASIPAPPPPPMSIAAMSPPYRGVATIPAPRGDANSMLAHQQLVQKAKAGGIDLYFLGDSITRRWGTSDPQYAPMLENWKQNFFGWNAGNFGWGADSIQNILWRIQNGELEGVDPKVIVILAGTNNVGTNPGGEAKVADITNGIRALVDTSRQKAPGAKIVLTAIFPRNDNMAVWPEIQQINRGIEKLADGKTVFYLNVNDKLASPDGTLFEGMMGDKLHPTVKGYKVWADGLRPLLTQLLGPPATTDHAPPPTGDPSAK